MQNTVTELFKFQEVYLDSLLSNIPEERLYEKQLKGYNSAGWLIGHLCIEAEDVFNHLDIPFEPVHASWTNWFRNSTGTITSLEGLPNKNELLKVFKKRYEALCLAYENLSPRDRFSKNPSKLLEGKLPNLDAWFAHHLTTHLAIHCGNIAIWKKVIGIKVEGY